jgi:putative addiction module component (TIGR02574 family)
LRDSPLYGTLVDVIKETIPELQKLSTADKFALAVELWDELSSNPDEIPVTEEQLNELDRRFEKAAWVEPAGLLVVVGLYAIEIASLWHLLPW